MSASTQADAHHGAAVCLRSMQLQSERPESVESAPENAHHITTLQVQSLQLHRLLTETHEETRSTLPL